MFISLMPHVAPPPSQIGTTNNQRSGNRLQFLYDEIKRIYKAIRGNKKTTQYLLLLEEYLKEFVGLADTISTTEIPELEKRKQEYENIQKLLKAFGHLK